MVVGLWTAQLLVTVPCLYSGCGDLDSPTAGDSALAAQWLWGSRPPYCCSQCTVCTVVMGLQTALLLVTVHCLHSGYRAPGCPTAGDSALSVQWLWGSGLPYCWWQCTVCTVVVGLQTALLLVTVLCLHSGCGAPDRPTAGDCALSAQRQCTVCTVVVGFPNALPLMTVHYLHSKATGLLGLDI